MNRIPLLLAICALTVVTFASASRAADFGEFVSLKDKKGNSFLLAYNAVGLKLRFRNGKEVTCLSKKLEPKGSEPGLERVKLVSPYQTVLDGRFAVISEDIESFDNGDWDGHVDPVRYSAQVQVYDIDGKIREDYQLPGEPFSLSPKGRHAVVVDAAWAAILYDRGKPVRSFPAQVGFVLYSEDERFISVSERSSTKGIFTISEMFDLKSKKVALSNKSIFDESLKRDQPDSLSNDGRQLLVGPLRRRSEVELFEDIDP